MGGGQQGVEDDRFVAAGGEGGNDVGSDEAGAAGDEYAHGSDPRVTSGLAGHHHHGHHRFVRIHPRFPRAARHLRNTRSRAEAAKSTAVISSQRPRNTPGDSSVAFRYVAPASCEISGQ